MLLALHDLSTAAALTQASSAGSGAADQAPPAGTCAEERHPSGLRGDAPACSPALPASAQILAFPVTAASRTFQSRTAAWPRHALAHRPGRSADGTQATSQTHPLAAVRPIPVEVARCLTVADRMAVLAWGSHGGGGYARMVLEEGSPGATPDRGGYVLLYRSHDRWATLGLTRCVTGMLVWRCSDGASLGTYATMAAALAALPPAASPVV